ncbi:MAG: N,N-dimethylformamidase beta subunit family domain-containing protein [Dongiaceae bacterium]
MHRILGYADRWTLRPGETVRMQASCDDVARYRADIVRLICGDDMPAGPGFKETVVAELSEFAGRFQPIEIGSFGIVAADPALDTDGAFAIALTIFPTMPGEGEQCLMARARPDRRAGWGLFIDDNARLRLRIGDGKGEFADLAGDAAVPARRWLRIVAGYDPASGDAFIAQRNVTGFPLDAPAGVKRARLQNLNPAESGLDLTVAAVWSGRELKPRMTRFYNGRIEAPTLLHGSLPESEIDALLHGGIDGATRTRVVAAWDFAQGMSSERMIDIGPHKLDGRLVNMPTRAVTGSRWDGSVQDWTRNPDHYAAVHFHDDDLEDCGWGTDFTFTVPADLKTGIYAARLTGLGEHAGEEERIPFFVVPAKSAARAKIAFLASTHTFMAYANSHYRTDDADMEMKSGNFLTLNPWELYLNEHRELGMSPYDTHSDGTGVCYSSRLRPLFSMQVKNRVWAFNGDMHVTDWLEAKRFDYDIVTDDMIHEDGLAALEPYNVIVTGAHPEYWSTVMWDAAVEYQQQGGRLMYLGGNGFYWRHAVHPEKPHVIEIRRAESGARYWGTAPGEAYHSFTGEYGGLWRRLGRAPQGLVGVGTVATGFDFGSYYRRMKDAANPRAAWIFEGVADEIIGDFGSKGGGAAGEEIDRADFSLGTPAHALILARSEAHSRYFNLAPEETLFHHPTINGEEAEACYADIVFYECPNGGALFATGSISWPAALAHEGYDNNVSRITENVLRRFADDAPFKMPESSE